MNSAFFDRKQIGTLILAFVFALGLGGCLKEDEESQTLLKTGCGIPNLGKCVELEAPEGAGLSDSCKGGEFFPSSGCSEAYTTSPIAKCVLTETSGETTLTTTSYFTRTYFIDIFVNTFGYGAMAAAACESLKASVLANPGEICSQSTFIDLGVANVDCSQANSP